ncbi:MAG: DDE-type integrase/transposase/recombinase [Nitrospira sp.]|nr:DDE-type integrase/transposase/recombinase [Nitrospira sp.]
MNDDRYLTIDEVMRWTAWSRATVYRRLAEGDLAVKPGGPAGGQSSGNGKAQSLIRLASLPSDVQLRYWHAQQVIPTAEPESLNLAEVPDQARAETQQRISLVHRALAMLDGIERNPKGLAMLAIEAGLSVATLYRWIKAYRARGVAGIVPQYGKNKGKFLALSDALQAIISQEYLRPERPSVTDVHRTVWALCEEIRQPAPSVATINRFLATIPRPLVIAQRLGPKAYRAQAEPKIRRDYADLAVGEMWVGDHRELDLFVKGAVDANGKLKVFRPWLTAWVDLRSRACVGWHLDLVPNSHTIALAMRAGILRFGLPQRLYMDNGKDYTANFWGGKSLKSRSVEMDADTRTVLAQLHVGVTHAQPYTPWAKAIESWFGHTFPSWERTLKGWCGRDNKERPEKLAGEIASGQLLTLDELRAALTDRIERYHDTEHSALNGTPRQQWQGVQKCIPDPRALDVVLMKHKPAKVYQDGIRLFGLTNRYWHEALIPLQGRTIEIRYDPANIGELVCFVDRNFVCTARQDKAFSMSLTEQERKELVKRRRAARQILTDYRQTQTIAHDQEQALDLVVNDIRRSKVYVLKSNPVSGPVNPEPGGGVVPTILGTERAAAARASQGPAAPLRPTGSRTGLRPSSADPGDQDHDAIMDQLLNG